MTKEISTPGKITGDKVKVLIVDDSPMMCKALEQILGEDEQIQVESRALNGREALNKLSSRDFDVCTLDVHMPGMNGLTVLKNIMVRYPIPTLMISAFTGDGSRVTFEALRFGAVDFFKKPTWTGNEELQTQADILRSRLKRASRVQVEAARYLRIKPVNRTSRPAEHHGSNGDIRGVGIIHGSTGGYSSLLSIVPQLSALVDIPVIVSLGTSLENTNAFVEYLRPFSPLPLIVAGAREHLKPGHVYFLSDHQTGTFDQTGGMWEMIVEKRPIDVGNEGAIDLILLSASESFGDKCLAVFVSGDNNQGMTGAAEVVRSGGMLLAQTPENCLAPFLPEKMIKKLGAESHGPAEIAKRISTWMK